MQDFTSRRGFLMETSRMAAASALAGIAIPRVHAAEDNTIQVALVGCGGRGTGAVCNALSTKGPTKLWAMADVFDNRLQSSLQTISKQLEKQVEVPKDRQFVGMDGYKKAIDSLAPGGVVVLATPAAFRPLHVEYAVSKRCHVFMEKSFAVDAPGVRRLLKAGEEATRKNLKLAGGLMTRHHGPTEEAVRQIHDGAIGEVITSWSYREHGPVGFSPKPAGMSELAHQIRNFYCFTWLAGNFMVDWLIHDIDVCCWAKNAWPVSAQGQGGRQVRAEPDQMFDHCAVDFGFADGTRLVVQGRHIAGCWDYFGDVIHAAKGSATLGSMVPNPRLYKAHLQTAEHLLWQYRGPKCDYYQREHDLLFEAIREDKPYNETDRCARATLASILGRMAVESGTLITWDVAMASNLELAPGLDQYTMESNPPVMPDAQGRYPIAIPGTTKVL
jgi:myo-inositol 2-dehydrogenase / D-chiro-inositol 1-dehydrogenase